MSLQPLVPPVGGMRLLSPIPVPEGGPTPLWWVQRLAGELEQRQRDNAFYRRYADGDQDSPTLQEAASLEFKRIAGLSMTNLCGLVRDSSAQKLTIQGFRFGGSDRDDDDAWAIWQDNDFDAESEALVSEALTVGRSFITVEPPAADGLSPRLYSESADQMIVAYEPGRRRNRRAALKMFGDEWTGDTFATLILPDAIYKLRRPARLSGGMLPSQWQLRDPDIEGEPNPLRTVPVFELRVRPQLDGSVRSDIADVTSDQDACNHIALQALIAAEYAAFRQKWASGIDIPVDPVTKQPIETFNVAVNRMFTTPNSEARFGDYGATDLAPYVTLYESRVRHMAATSQTPLAALTGAMPNVAAETLALTVSGHIGKVKRYARQLDDPFESAMRCAFLTLRDARALSTRAETIWLDPEVHSWAELGDMASKLVPGVMSAETFQERYMGMSSTERDRDRARRQQADAMAQLAGVLGGQNIALPGDATPAADEVA